MSSIVFNIVFGSAMIATILFLIYFCLTYLKESDQICIHEICEEDITGRHQWCGTPTIDIHDSSGRIVETQMCRSCHVYSKLVREIRFVGIRSFKRTHRIYNKII